MLGNRHLPLLACLATLMLATTTSLAQEPEKKVETPAAAAPATAVAPVIVGNPPADHPFGKLKIGMTYEEAIAIAGKPGSEGGWCTGKHRIPFYFGNDKARTEAHFKGMGKLDFNADASIFPFGICKAGSPRDLVYIEYNPDYAGEAPK